MDSPLLSDAVLYQYLLPAVPVIGHAPDRPNEIEPVAEISTNPTADRVPIYPRHCPPSLRWTYPATVARLRDLH